MELTPEIEQALEETLRERLEADLVAMIAQCYALDSARAMELYYSSRLARQIGEGLYGIQYLDAKHLFEDLVENEPELFEGLVAAGR